MTLDVSERKKDFTFRDDDVPIASIIRCLKTTGFYVRRHLIAYLR